MCSRFRNILFFVALVASSTMCNSVNAANVVTYDFSHVRQPLWGAHKDLLTKIGVNIQVPNIESDINSPRTNETVRYEVDYYLSAIRELYSLVLGTDEEIERKGIQKNEELLGEPQQVLKMIYFISWVSGWHEELSKSLDPLGIEDLIKEQRRKNFLKSLVSGRWSTVEISESQRDRSEVHEIQIRLKLIEMRLSDLKKHLKPYFLPSLNCIVALETARKK